jgi:ssDNA-binding Zn-finger/Zn-ribbon topoisomerase 1
MIKNNNWKPYERRHRFDSLGEGLIKKLGNTPLCPSCGSAMVIRTAKHGKTAGESFYGCSIFPACKATVPTEYFEMID